MRSAPEIPPDSEASRVIIVGYGRVGALIGDMLDRHAIPFIAVDANARRDVARPAPTASRSITATPRGPNICAAAGSRRRAPSSSPWIRPPPTKRWSRRRAASARRNAGRPRPRRRPRPRALRARRDRRGAGDDRGEPAALRGGAGRSRRADGPRHRLDPREARRIPQAARGRRRARASALDARAAAGVGKRIPIRRRL